MDMIRQLDLVVNGDRTPLNIDENTPLLYVLRNQLNLKGVRFGCGEGYCGACTVLVDGKAMQSCSTPVWSVEGKNIVTIEAARLDPDSNQRLADLLQLFVEEQAAQCGFCIPGIMMSIYFFTGQYPTADAGAVLNYLAERNLCRCGTHYRIAKVIQRYMAMFREEESCQHHVFAD